MKRYHRSFIGLMEHCKDGEWVRFDEAKKVIYAQDESIVILKEELALQKEAKTRLSARHEELRGDYIVKSADLNDARDSIGDLKSALFIETVLFAGAICIWYFG
jgi:hypothetical protein